VKGDVRRGIWHDIRKRERNGSRSSSLPSEREKNGRRHNRRCKISDEDSSSRFESSSSSESDGEKKKTAKVYRTEHLLKPP